MGMYDFEEKIYWEYVKISAESLEEDEKGDINNTVQ